MSAKYPKIDLTERLCESPYVKASGFRFSRRLEASVKKTVDDNLMAIKKSTKAREVAVCFVSEKFRHLSRYVDAGGVLSSIPANKLSAFELERYRVRRSFSVEGETYGVICAAFDRNPPAGAGATCQLATVAFGTVVERVLHAEEAHRRVGDFLKGISLTIKMKDIYTYYHCIEVQTHAAFLASMAGLTPESVEALSIAGLLHDIGKIAVPANTLTKPATLSTEEFTLIKQHPKIAADYLNEFPDFQELAPFVLHHHERWDGRGYPSGLKGQDIPVESRILAIADSYDAMIGLRPYKAPMDKPSVLAEIRRQAGLQFDPVLARLFADCMERKKHEVSSVINLGGANKN